MAESLILHLSDLHYGQNVSSEFNVYNTAIARERLEYYFSKALIIGRDVYSRCAVDTVHIFLTGDMVHNETMRGSAKMSAEINVIEQINGIAEVLADNITKFVSRWKAINAVHLYGVPGNHGRIGLPGENDEAANYDRQVYRQLQLMLDARWNRASGRRICYHFPKRGEVVSARIAGWSIVAHHAHGIHTQLGIPYYGLARLRDRLYKMCRGRMDVLLVGHYHRSYTEHDGAIRTIMCPSLVGWDEYVGRTGACHHAAQNLYMIHPKHGITTIRTIDVGSVAPLRAAEPERRNEK